MSDLLTIDGLLSQHVAAKPDEVCLIYRDRAITYAQFDDLVNRCARWLISQGVGPGERIALWLTNQPEWLGMLFGAARIGVGIVTVNTRYRASEVEHILTKSRARMLIMQRSFRSIDFAAIMGDMNSDTLVDLQTIALVGNGSDVPETIIGRPVVKFDSSLAYGEEAVGPHTDGSSPFIHFATSGTTKAPKLVQHTQHTAAWHSRKAAAAYGFDQSGAVTLAAVPLCGVYGFDSTLASLTGGAPIVLMETFEPNEAYALIDRYRVTHLFGTDDLYRQLLNVTSPDYKFPTARLFAVAFYTAGWRARASYFWDCHLPLRGIYGSSETHAIFSIQPDSLPFENVVEPGGFPAAGEISQVRIRDDETGAILPIGQSGDLEIKSPGNFVGYFNDPDATSAVLTEDGYFRTGDIGYLRGDGTFVYESRKGDALRLSGFLVNPTEIEDEIKAISNVADAQVVSLEIEGQLKAVAFVIPAEGTDVDQSTIAASLKSKLAPFKIPSRVWSVPEFPVTLSPNGIKVQRAKLRDMAVENLKKEARV